MHNTALMIFRTANTVVFFLVIVKNFLLRSTIQMEELWKSTVGYHFPIISSITLTHVIWCSILLSTWFLAKRRKYYHLFIILCVCKCMCKIYLCFCITFYISFNNCREHFQRAFLNILRNFIFLILAVIHSRNSSSKEKHTEAN